MIENSKGSDELLSGYIFFNSQKEKSLNQKDTLRAIYNLRMIIIAQTGLGLLYDGEASIVEALNLIDNLEVNDSTVVAGRMALYNSLGVIYRSLNKYDRAIEIYDKALVIAQRSSDSISLYNNIANVYKDKGNFFLAEKEFYKVYNERLKFDTDQMIAKALDNLGSVRGKLGNETGLLNMLQALQIRMLEKDFQYYYLSYTHLREYYKDKDDLETARHYAKLGYEAASLYSESYKVDALSHLLELRDDPLVLEYIQMEDSLKEARLLNEKKFSSAKYNLGKEQQRTFLSVLKGEREKSKRILYQLLGVLVLLLSIFVYFVTKSRHKKEKTQQVYNTEKRISKKIHDELANDMFQVMTQLQNTPKDNEKIIDSLDQIYSKTRNISFEYSALDVKGDYKEVLQDLLLSYSGDKVNVITKGLTKVDWEAVSEIKRTTIYKVLQELMINMKKHSQASVAVLSFSETRKKISISYNDNGIGCVLKKNTGLMNVENRISSIKGSLIFKSEINKGFKVKVTV